MRGRLELLIFVQERHLLLFLMCSLHSKIIDVPRILRQIKVAAGISFISFDFLLVSSDLTTIVKVEEEEHGRKK